MCKVKDLLLSFQIASQSYEQKMNEFKISKSNRLLEGCRQQDNVFEQMKIMKENLIG